MKSRRSVSHPCDLQWFSVLQSSSLLVFPHLFIKNSLPRAVFFSFFVCSSLTFPFFLSSSLLSLLVSFSSFPVRLFLAGWGCRINRCFKMSCKEGKSEARVGDLSGIGQGQRFSPLRVHLSPQKAPCGAPLTRLWGTKRPKSPSRLRMPQHFQQLALQKCQVKGSWPPKHRKHLRMLLILEKKPNFFVRLGFELNF